jgi:putative heme degradation protein
VTNCNQHSPSLWSLYKRAKAAERRAQAAAEKLEASNAELASALIGIAAKYIQTAYIHDFSNEVRAFMDEHHKEYQT